MPSYLKTEDRRLTPEDCYFTSSGLQQLEAERRLRRQHDVLVAGERRTRSARARARQHADGSALAAAGQTADDRAQSGASAHRHGGSLALALGGLGDGCRLNFVRVAADLHGVERQPQPRAALEASQRHRFRHRSARLGARGDQHLAVNLDRLRHRRRKRLPRRADLRSHRLPEPHHDVLPGGHDLRLRSRGFRFAAAGSHGAGFGSRRARSRRASGCGSGCSGSTCSGSGCS